MAATAKVSKRTQYDDEEEIDVTEDDVAVSDKKFLATVTKFMERWGYGDSEFGRLALKDPNFVQEVRSGQRSPTLRLVTKVLIYMKKVTLYPHKYRHRALPQQPVPPSKWKAPQRSSRVKGI